MFPGQIVDDEEFDGLLKSLEAGIPTDCLDLLSLPFQMSREEYLALNAQGIKNKEQLYLKSKSELGNILEPATVDAVYSSLRIIKRKVF